MDRFNKLDSNTKIAIGGIGAAALSAFAYYLYKQHSTSAADSGKDSKSGAGSGGAKSGSAVAGAPAPLPSAHHASGYTDSIPIRPSGRFPTLGFGTMLSDGDAAPQMAQAIKDAIKIGYRHFDCAPVYRNEKEVGAALNEVISAGTVKRSDLFITTKLWTTKWDDVRGACLASLADLKLDYLDLYIIHWPFENSPVSADVKEGKAPAPQNVGYSAERVLHAWKQLEALVDEGLVRAIGVSNFGIAKLQKLVGKTRIPIAVNQIEAHPFLTQPELLDYCKKNDIVVASYFVIGSIRRVKLLRTDDDPVLLDDKTIASIAAEVKATPAQVLTSWALHRGTVPIVKSISAKRIQENWDAYSVALTNAQIKRIDALNRNYRYINAVWFAYPLSGSSAAEKAVTQRALWDNEGCP